MYNNFNNYTYESFDDLLIDNYKKILEYGTLASGKRGRIKELVNFSATLTNPRSRISHSLERRLVRSKFAELAWYLTKDSEKKYIEKYIHAYKHEKANEGRIPGAYGPKIFKENSLGLSQFKRIIQQLNARETTKQAYLSISESNDYRLTVDTHSSPPCTIGLHFFIRSEYLHLTVYMRSNDAYLGFPHDLFSFTMLQEMIANITKKRLGTYTHVCTSFHIYKENIPKVEAYIKEGYQEKIEMPPIISLSDEILNELSIAFDNSITDYSPEHLDDYWIDYTLFSDRYFKKIPQGEWISKFKNDDFKKIAINSITT